MDLEGCGPRISITHFTVVLDWPRTPTRESKVLTRRAEAARPRPDAPEEAPGAPPHQPASHAQPPRSRGLFPGPAHGAHWIWGAQGRREPPVTHGGWLTRVLGEGHPVRLPARQEHFSLVRSPQGETWRRGWPAPSPGDQGAPAGPTAVMARRTDRAQASGPT